MDKFVFKYHLIEIFTFAFHLLLSGGLVILGLIAIELSNDTQSALFAYFLAAIIFSTSLFMLLKKRIQFYFLSVLTTLLSIIAWIIIEGSVDAQSFLPLHLFIFTPLSIYRAIIENKG